jgi:hypothetical protein
MKTEVKSKGIEVKEARTALTVPHLDGKLTFAYPAKGPGIYQEVGQEIDNDKLPSQLYRPTIAETISLIHAAVQDKDNNKYVREVMDILHNRNRYLYCFTKNLWTPEGVYAADDRDGSPLNRQDLERRLQANDSSVRFVPYGFKLGEQTPEELEVNPLIKAHAGEEGAQKLAEIASEFKKRPFVRGLEKVTKDKERITGLYGGWNGSGLCFDGDFFDGGGSGFAFGVQK